MKVSTDACILGAATPVPKIGNILDIGAGTGLLSLMMAQRSLCEIDAVEMDEQSFLQAKSNIQKSPWSNRIHLYHEDVRLFSPSKKYDLIVCNPPFFEKHLKSLTPQKNRARHADNLSLMELTTLVHKLLNAGGKFSVLLPEKESERMITLAATYSLFLQQQLFVRDRVSLPVVSAMSIFSGMINKNVATRELICKNEDGYYSSAFVELMKPFYLKL